MRLWVGLLCTLVCMAQEGARPQLRAFWVDAFHAGFRTPNEVDKMVADAIEAKANVLIIEARHRGAVYYLKSQEPPTEDRAYQQGFDALQYTIDKAHARGIEVHLWSPVTPLWDSTAKPPVDPKHPWNLHGPAISGPGMWLTVNAAGRMSRSIDLGHPGAAKYTADVFIDALRNYDLDGIHLDYIRYPEDDRYGWNPTAVDRFNTLYARDEIPVEGDPAWLEFRQNQVTQFVRQVYLRAHEIKPSVKVTAALITWGDGPPGLAEFRRKDAYLRVYQNWPAWMEEGIIDIGMPMNYFREGSNAGYLTRWLAFEKENQGKRTIMPGIATYLNSIPDSMAQVGRVLNTADGIVFYSYASTNTLNASGVPVTPNAEFYRAVSEYFKDPAPVPALPWLTAPKFGHLLGTLTVDGSAALADGVQVTIESEVPSDVRIITRTDGTGFFGAVDLVPGSYFIRMARNGREIYRTVPLKLEAGKSIRFDVFLKEADFAALAPRVVSADVREAAPNQVVVLQVANLDVPNTPAAAVPLARGLAGVQARVNGIPAALSSVGPGRVDLLLPMTEGEGPWRVEVQRDALRSAPFEIARTAAKPVISGIRRTAWGIEIYATGLGATMQPLAPGAGGSPTAPYHTVASAVRVTVNGEEREVLFAGLVPYQPYVYQVNVRLPEDLAAGEVALTVAGNSAQPYRF